jgi:hypothetical protein
VVLIIDRRCFRADFLEDALGHSLRFVRKSSLGIGIQTSRRESKTGSVAHVVGIG